ncbi:MAG: hypothetical protein ACHQ6T_16245 [Myxococcota bacterium]
MSHSPWLRALVVLAWLAAACAAPDSAAPPRTLQSFDRRDADVYLVPVGAFSEKYLVDLASYCENVFGLAVGVTAPLRFEPSIVDAERKQLIAQAAIQLIAKAYASESSNPRTIYVGVTHVDMYIQGGTRSFAYSDRIGNVAIATSSRTARDPQPSFAEITELQPGLRKLVANAIGLLYYKKAPSSNPHSVLFAPILAREDLDAIDESTVYPDILGRSRP